MDDTQRARANTLLQELIDALAAVDDSVNPRVLRDVAVKAVEDGEFLGDRALLLDRARRQTHGVQRTAGLEREKAERLKQREDPASVLGSRLTQEAVEALEPSVLRLRETCFGSNTPPFNSIDAAAKWIEQHSVHPSEAAQRSHDDKLIELKAKWAAEVLRAARELDRVDPWNSYAAYDHAMESRPLYIEYWGTDGLAAARRVAKTEEPLATIRKWVDLAAARTTLPASSLVAYVLAGAVPGQRIKLSNGQSVILPGLAVLSGQRMPWGADQIVLTLDARELTDRNLRRIRRQAARLVNTKRRTGKQHRVVAVVQQLGGPPAVRFDREFWGRVARRLKVSDPIAAARRYYRATGRVIK